MSRVYHLTLIIDDKTTSILVGMMFKSLIFILLTLSLCGSSKINSWRVGRLLDGVERGDRNFSSITYDALHESIVSDQIDSYIRPIKSLYTRHVKLLNGLYEFCFDPEAKGFVSKWHEQPLGYSCPKQDFSLMPVPSAFNDVQSINRNYMGWMWYQTTEVTMDYFDAQFRPVNWLIQFDNINYMCIIWIQVIRGGQVGPSKLIGAHVGGHLPIVVNITSVINSEPNNNSNNNNNNKWHARIGVEFRLTIAVSNMLNENTIPSGQMVNMTSVVGKPYYKFQPDFDFFHYAGIMGDVQLIGLPTNYIERISYSLSRDNQVESLFDLDLELCINNWPLVDLFAIREGIDYQLTYSLSGSSTLYTMSDVQLISQSESYTIDSTSSSKNSGSNSNCFALSLCPNKVCNMREHFVEWPPLSTDKRPKSIRFQLLVNRTLENGTGTGTGGTQCNHLIERDVFELKLVMRANMTRMLSDQVGGQSQQLQGFGMHHEQLFSGRTMSLPAIMKDLYLLKELGANVLRTSHYPYSSAYLSACDELGIMVIAECPAVGLKSFSDAKLQLHKQILLEMMERDHGHASIIMWSVANEPESQQAQARNYFQQLLQFARINLAQFTSEAGRPLTAALAQSHLDDKIGDLLDVIMVNRYYGWYDYPGLLNSIKPSLLASLGGWAQKYGKPLLLSEFGADTLAGLHSSGGVSGGGCGSSCSLARQWQQQQQQPGQLFTEEYQRDLIVEYELVFDQLAATAASNRTPMNFIGSMIWNFADFSAHESLLRVNGNKKGIFTRDRRPKLAVESVKSIYLARLKRSRAEVL